MDYKNKDEILKCNHEWKDNLLLYSTVTDCSKCHVKKEDWETLSTLNNAPKQTSFSDLMYEELTHDKYSDDANADGYFDWF